MSEEEQKIIYYVHAIKELAVKNQLFLFAAILRGTERKLKKEVRDVDMQGWDKVKILSLNVPEEVDNDTV